MPPRPAGGVPYPPPGIKMPPVGMKMPPRPAGVAPMGYPVPPGGMKMPPRPAGVAPIGAVPPVPPGVVPPPPSAVSEPDDIDLDKEWGDDPQEETEPEVEAEADENGFIDDLEGYPKEEEEKKEEVKEERPRKHSIYENNLAASFGLPPFVIRTKFLMFTFLFFIIFGAVLGYGASLMQSGGGGGMQGLVNNNEIPKGRPRCGLAQKGQGCVLYVMNAQRREVEGRDFFGMAADILGVPRFQIETANIRYATTRIPPGYIALLNIPPIQ